MKLSKYNYVVPIDDRIILYNFLSTSFVVVEKDRYYQYLSGCYGDDQSILTNGYFLVDDDITENNLYLRILAQTKEKYKKSPESLVILTTTACNARCYYCYEQGLAPISMSDGTAEAVANFIIKHVNESETKRIGIRWFGGEPLINVPAIDKICSILKLHNIDYYSSMSSNGYLFDNDMVQRAKREWNLRLIQITLDGIGENYNNAKNFININNAFSVVISNIKTLISKDISVSIRINYPVDNIESAKRTIDFLDSTFPDKTNLYVYCAALREEGKSAISTFTSEESPQLKLLQHLRTHHFIKNINSLLPSIKALPCEAWMDNHYFIYPNGEIFKCQHTLSDNEYEPLGDVYSGKMDQQVVNDWKFRDVPDGCSNCTMLPICQGGCRSVKDQGKYSDNACYQYKNSFDGLLKLYYKFYKEGV